MNNLFLFFFVFQSLSPAHLESQMQQESLPFLRVAALLKHYLLQAELPAIHDPDLEFGTLVRYLDLAMPAKVRNPGRHRMYKSDRKILQLNNIIYTPSMPVPE